MQTFICYEFQVHQESVDSTMRVLWEMSDFSFVLRPKKVKKKKS